MSTLERALALAAESHAGQLDKGGAPYILHPLRVMAAMTSNEERIVAVLHDVAEDCPAFPLSRLAAEFGDRIGHALDALTKRTGEQYSEYLDRVAANPLARAANLADIKDNSNLERLGRHPLAEDEERRAKYAVALSLRKLTDAFACLKHCTRVQGAR
ncbi:HD domain-containing protein [Devosia sp. RR2S18]|uniref:HD domain-containing protein n=1 Tax=Devosia rhizosphaerae TaxID=3049774 RepID=UPI0025401DA3|nr:HD domain-containing protein [Devosia sp. RR2S18]WIJ25779.1 HD domain-containing protein [Devosia sp. RR2S18]